MRSIAIGIVGGGSVGVSFLAQLLKCMGERPPTPSAIKVYLFEPRAAPGAGDAYANDLNTNLLNIPVRNMSAYADDKQHFCRWLEAQSPETLASFNVNAWNDDSFLPRPLFGRYMEETFHQTQRCATALGVLIEHVRHRVSAIERSEHGQHWRILTDGGCYQVDHAVLCNGNLPSVAFPELENTPCYFNSPYPVMRLTESVSPDDSVAVVGTSLSAVDAIVALKEAGHRGKVVAVSRNGRLPSVRSKKNRRTVGNGISAEQLRNMARANGGTLTLRQIADTMMQMLSELGGNVDLPDILGGDACAAEQLSQEIEVSQSRERLWQVVASSLNDVIEVIWHLLDEPERQTFRTQWRSLWMTRRATFPIENALKLQRYFRAQQLAVYGGFESCHYDEGRNQYCVRLRSSGKPSTGPHANGLPLPNELMVDHIINATSFSLNVSDSPDPLVRQWLDSGIAQADKHGGIKLDYDTGCLVDRHGGIQENITLLGSLAVGTYFWTLSMDVNARLALSQAKRLAARLMVRPTEIEENSVV